MICGNRRGKTHLYGKFRACKGGGGEKRAEYELRKEVQPLVEKEIEGPELSLISS